MSILFTALLFLFIAWAINAPMMTRKSSEICGIYLSRLVFGKVGEVFEYHSPFRLSSWFGFRPHFYPYILKDHAGNTIDN